jgi:predicted NAD/FAD-dependent oxidoreductase
MARGAGGRMSTTRYGTDAIKANTGAQYVSCFSPEATKLLEAVCDVERVDDPLKRSTHFVLQPDEAYTHWLPRGGTNSVVKQFLSASSPNKCTFESRLQRITHSLDGTQFFPQFDRGGMSPSFYDVIVLAMPPKDILRFFNEGSHPDPQSQADLHRRTNRGRSGALPEGQRHVTLPSDVIRRLRIPSYNGRYSLALWFEDSDDAKFVNALWAAWQSRKEPHAIIDLISPQQGVLVAQSTVDLWQRVETKGKGKSGGRGGGKGGRYKSTGGSGRKPQQQQQSHEALPILDQLTQICSQRKFGNPEFAVREGDGGGFSCTVTIKVSGSTVSYSASARSKKDAKKMAAQQAVASQGGRVENNSQYASAGEHKVAEDSLDEIRGGGRNAARSYMVTALEALAGCKMPRTQHTKLLNWRTSQASPPLLPEDEPVITAEGGHLVFTGDWCVESSFEGCNLAAQAAATAAANAISPCSELE